MNRTEFSISPTDINMRKEPKESVFFRHPFLVSALICLLCAVLTFGSQYYISAQSVILISASFCYALSLIFSRTQFGKTADPRYRALIYTAFVALSALTGVLLAESEHKAVFILGLGLIVCLIVFIYLFVMQRLTVQRIVLLLFAVGFLLRLTYVLYTSCMERQHDVTTIGSGEGHLGYIEYLYQNASLPDFDVRTVWQFYHPPLHHFFSALWMKLLTVFGAGYEQACESIQILTLFYSSCCMIISYKIFKSFYLRGRRARCCLRCRSFSPHLYNLCRRNQQRHPLGNIYARRNTQHR
ncbi:MAG: hypothetical protein LUF33_05045 [Clostridiales bacterium]|nr:hypothetical protein [Clostridiales bacterium]